VPNPNRRLFLVSLDEQTHRALANEAHRRSIATGKRVYMSSLLAHALHESPWFRSGFAVRQSDAVDPRQGVAGGHDDYSGE